jgi:hypothetical protein
MGLDQYASARKGEPTLVETGTTTYDDENGKEVVEKIMENEWADSYDLCDWRKHPNLQGFMEDLWDGKGSPGEDGEGFNCVDLELTLEDIDELEIAIKGADLPETGGFIFGGDSSEYYKEQDLQFCEDAKEALGNGYTVIYSSWY